MKKIVFIMFCSIFISCTNAGKDVITLESLLKEMTDPYALTKFSDIEYSTLQFSSYDRASVCPGDKSWFANGDGFGYERLDTISGRVEKVLFEEMHPGVVTRIWITTHTPTAVLRFYFDGSDVPGWVINAFDFTEFGLKALQDNPLLLTHTSYEKGVKGGQTFFLPIPYSKGLKITLEDPYDNVPRYYHINCRRYPDDAEIESFSVDVADRASGAIIKAGRILSEQMKPKGRRIGTEAKLETGGTMILELPKGERAVREICFEVECQTQEKYAQTMRELIFSAEFDGKSCVNVPLSDFSAGGLGAPEVKCRQLISDGNGKVISYWVMPYSEAAVLTLTNISESMCTVRMSAVTERHDFTDKTLYFHSSWHKEDSLPVTDNHAECREWTFASIEGRGNYVGDVLTLFNSSPAWYGEGDEKIYVDKEEFPSHFGTGTEDYYNSSWAPVVVFHTPFGGAPRADQESSHGYNTFFRTRLLDNIPFKDSFKFDLELISWSSGTVDYAAVTYWYGDADSKAVIASDPMTDRYVLPPVPYDMAAYYVGGMEFEKTAIYSKPAWILADRQGMTVFPDGKWSGAKQLTFVGGKPGDIVSFVYDNIEPGCYDIILYATKARDYGKVTYILNGKEASEFDGYDMKVTDSGPISLGRCNVMDGVLKLDVAISGKNPSSSGFLFGLDCLKITKVE